MWGKKSASRGVGGESSIRRVRRVWSTNFFHAKARFKLLFQRRPKTVLSGIGLILLLLIGSLFLGWNEGLLPGSTVGSCSRDKRLIGRYNEQVKNEGVTRVGEVVELAKAKNNMQDPTCLYIVMIGQYGDQTSNKELETYVELSALESQGKKISDDIDDGIDRQALVDIIKQQIEDREKGYDGEG